MAIIKTISDLLWGMPLIVLILLAGIIFTVGSKFFQIAHLKHILKNTIGSHTLYILGQSVSKCMDRRRSAGMLRLYYKSCKSIANRKLI